MPAPQEDENTRLRTELEALKQEAAWLKNALVAALFAVGILFVTVIFLFKELQKQPSENPSAKAKHADIKPLINLLKDLFQAKELQRFLHQELGDEGLEVVQSISADDPLDGLVYTAVVAMNNRGMIDKPLFDALAAARPKRKAEIRKMEKSCKKLKPAA